MGSSPHFFNKRFATHRTKDFVRNSYNKAWEGFNQSWNPVILEFNKDVVLWPAVDTRRFRVLYFSRAIKDLELRSNIRSVLELGSGSGINVLALAVLHLEIKIWNGVELTQAGVKTAKKLLEHPPIKHLRYITGLDEQTIRERLSKSDIRFVEGDILNLPFKNNSFDLVYSALAIEQIPQEYPWAFREARRVCAGYAFFLEEFLEAQNIFHRMSLSNLDYFCASYREVEKADFRIIKYEPYPLSKLDFRLGFLLCSAGRYLESEKSPS